MIGAEELKRIIEKGEVVWGINTKGEVYKRTFHIRPCYKENFIKNFDYSKGDYYYTTKEMAEWVADVFTTRTESFEPPYLETVKEIKKPVIYSFFSKQGANLKLEIVPADDYYAGKIYLMNGAYCIKDWELTKENWESACRYSKELFTGKKEDDK